MRTISMFVIVTWMPAPVTLVGVSVNVSSSSVPKMTTVSVPAPPSIATGASCAYSIWSRPSSPETVVVWSMRTNVRMMNRSLSAPPFVKSGAMLW